MTKEEEAKVMKKITSLQAKESLLQKTIDLEKEEKEIEDKEEAAETEEMKRKKQLQEQLDDEMELRQEEAKSKYLFEEFCKDAQENAAIPKSLVKLQSEETCNYNPFFYFSVRMRNMFIMQIYYFPVSLKRLRRNCRAILDFSKEGHSNDQIIVAGIGELRGLCKDIKEEIAKFTFHMEMNTHDVSSFFPANDNATILRFMEQDGEFNSRRHGFYELLKTCVSVSQKKFTDSLINTLFTVHYKSNIRWPCTR